MVDHSLPRNGNKVLVDNQPYVIMDTDFVNPGKGQAFTKIKIKNLLNKKTIEKTVKIGISTVKDTIIELKCQAFILIL